MQQKINLGKFAESIAAVNGCAISTAETFIKSLCALISDQLCEGKTIRIKGLGVFRKSDDKNEPIIFEIDKDLYNTINLPFSYFEPVILDDNLTEELLESELKTRIDLGSKEDEQGKNNQNEINVTEEVFETPNEASLNENGENDESVETQSELETYSNESSSEKQLTEETLISEMKQEQNNISDTSNCVIQNPTTNKENKPQNTNLLHIGLSLFLGLVIGFTLGFIAKGYYDNNEIVKQMNEQKAILDSLVSSNKVAQIQKDTTKCDTSNTIVDSLLYNQQGRSPDYKTDKVTRRRYLTTMAREHYGNYNFWVYIYEENKLKLGNPNAIVPGTIVVIPPANKYNIDASNPQSIQLAKKKAIEIYAKYSN